MKGKPHQHPDPNAESRMLEKQARIAREKQLGMMMGLAAFCAVAGFFIYLELSRPIDPPKPEAAAQTAEPAPVLETPAAPETPTAPVVESASPKAPAAAVPATPEPPPVAVVDPPAEAEPPAPLASEAPLLLTGMDSTRESAAQRDAKLLEKTIEHGAWNAYRALRATSIQAGIADLRQGHGLTRFDEVWQQPLLYRALLRWKTLGAFKEADLARQVPDLYSASFLLWLLDRPLAMEEFLLTIRPEDDSAKVLGFLMESWARNEELREKYFPLALACAVVFDRPVSIPHPIGGAYGSQAMVEPMARYLWYVEKNEAGKLAAPVHRSTARDLVWVVCAPVSTSELDWAIGNLHMHRKRWGETYGRIEYLMERAVEGENPYEEYSFAEIEKHGGICGDQTYFCVNTARAQGIPAMGLSGETSMGGHAWAGLMLDDREWTTAVGRIGGVSKGEAHHPQTGGRITEQEILHWNDRAHQSPATTLKVMRHLWLAALLGDTGKDGLQAETIRLANRLGPSFTETWQALYQVLVRETAITGEPSAPANLDEWQSFAGDVRREFKDNPRMAAIALKAENQYIFPYITLDDARRFLLRERRRIDRDSAEQADLVAASLKREAELIRLRGGDAATTEISRLYDRALRDFGGSVTGFKTMAADYFSFMRGDPEQARKAARDIELAFMRVVETGTKEWFRAQAESGIHRMICGYYRAAGDPKRAEMLEQRIEVLMRRAKRSAL
ncbi:MAG: hypothetical protein ACO3JG_03885 [Luteolibacter sp.]